MSKALDRMFDDLFAPMPDFNAPFEVDTRDLGAITEAFADAPHVLIDRRERSAFILSVAAYCQFCGHRQHYHDGGLGKCRYDDCGCMGWFPEAR